MTKPKISELITQAGEFKKENPDLPLTIFEVSVLMLLGAKPVQLPAEIEAYREAIASFTKPFTAGDLAAVVHAKSLLGSKPPRLLTNAAAAAAREITKRGPRKSNGNSVYDPI